MMEVKAKKFLGQHFLTDETVAQRIVGSLSPSVGSLLEVGPGMGVLTKYLIANEYPDFKVIEIDRESVAYLHAHFPTLKIIEGDFLKINLTSLFHVPFALIGNFPYNISSQILFRVYEGRNVVTEVVGMFQKEVAERVAAQPGNKAYGILSVLLSAFYQIDYLFSVSEGVFNPPPKVKSGVIRLVRNDVTHLECDEELFLRVVKAGFNQRRKTLRNALRQLSLSLDRVPADLLASRAEQLSVAQFVELTNLLTPCV